MANSYGHAKFDGLPQPSQNETIKLRNIVWYSQLIPTAINSLSPPYQTWWNQGISPVYSVCIIAMASMIDIGVDICGKSSIGSKKHTTVFPFVGKIGRWRCLKIIAWSTSQNSWWNWLKANTHCLSVAMTLSVDITSSKDRAFEYPRWTRRFPVGYWAAW